ncbi:Holliday junction branch migration DNA helicase RuvB [Candidatus Peregrinibacteria bacterium]|nr:MAG: Holliday junction branch migration DNA helicase RuvB [Candidatus Peregrinibacteria bacterium]
MPEENQSENVLRPQSLKDYVGQEELKRNLDVFLAAAQKRGEAMEHVLLHGCPGLGKTTLALILAKEMGVQIRNTSGPAIERPGDLAALLTNLQPNDVLFIDEIHRLRPAVEEILYSAMEDFCLDLVVGKGPSARSMRITLPKFTLIGATTKLSSLSSPLRDRFGNVLKLEFYSQKDIEAILKRSSDLLGISIEKTAAQRLAQSSRSTPRVANRLLRRARDFAHVNNHPLIAYDTVLATLELLGIDELGLDATDRKLLLTLAEKFKGGPVGLSTLSAASNEEEETVEDIYEPFLMQLGFLQRTPRGRLLTEKVYAHLGLSFANPLSQ